MKHVPNILTVFRLFLIPAFVYTYFKDVETGTIALTPLLIFLTAGFTDVLDGHIARKYDLITKIGTVLDPLADKLMLLTVMVCLYMTSFIPLWALLLMGSKEFSMILMGIYLYWHPTNTVIPANIFGKLTTVFFYLAITVMVVFPSSQMGWYFMIFAIASALVAFGNYMVKYFGIRGNLKGN